MKVKICRNVILLGFHDFESWSLSGKSIGWRFSRTGCRERFWA